jgi:hypothetical protein
MITRLFFATVLSSILVFSTYANTLTFIHQEHLKVSLQDAVYPHSLSYAPKFEYLTTTIFQIPAADFHFYSVTYKSEQYYLWLENSSWDLEIDLSKDNRSSEKWVLIKKNDWLSGKVNLNNAAVKKLLEIDLYYANALDSLYNLAQADDSYRDQKVFAVTVWDSRSSKRLFNLAMEQFNPQFDENWVLRSPAYTEYWQLMYKLYYQYFHKNSFKGITKQEAKLRIEEDFEFPENKVLMFHHFFRNGVVLSDLRDNYKVLNTDLSSREILLAEAAIQRQEFEDYNTNQSINFLFGIDIDGSMEAYFARDSSEKKNVLVFWSVWDQDILTEFNKLKALKSCYKDHYNFIHICIDAYESPEKSKALIYQNKVGGFHLLPEQSNAFRNSNYRKSLKIRDFPFYVLTNNKGEIMEHEAIPLEISQRLERKLMYFENQ